jgi:hypothetical protein
MAETNSPAKEDLRIIAQEILKRLVVKDSHNDLTFSFKSLNDLGSPSNSTLKMGATFELWRLNPSAIDKFEEESGDLTSLATRTGRWHHQIRLDDGAAAFARSEYKKEDEVEGWSVGEIFVSPRAEEIDKAILQANQEFPEDTLLVRLLTAPAYQVEALWFVDKAEAERGVETGGELLIVTAPSDNDYLAPLKRISAANFLETLRGMPVGMGINAETRIA